MAASVYIRLSVMMLLQYAVWGAWLPILSLYLENHLGFTGGQVGMILGLAGSIGAVTAPFIAGQVADRYFSTERCLAVLVVIGGVVKWYTAYQTTYGAWLILSILYSIVYMPTLALSNSQAFAHMNDPDREFPYVRVWGTIGWIAASWVFPMIWLQTDLQPQWLPPFLVGKELPGVTVRIVDCLKFSGIISIGYGLFCLFLPHTPPKRDAVEKLAFRKAFRLFRRRSFLVLVIASLIVSVIHQVYFMKTSPFLAWIGLEKSYVGPAMTIGQFAEIAVMALLGLFLKRMGFTRVIFIGAFAYFLRYAVFGTVDLPLWLIVASQALHGFCYACFFAAAYIYVERLAEEDIRHSAQTVFGIIILGVGPVLGGTVNGCLEKAFGTHYSFAGAQRVVRQETAGTRKSLRQVYAHQLRIREDFENYKNKAESKLPQDVEEAFSSTLQLLKSVENALASGKRADAARLQKDAQTAIQAAEKGIRAALRTPLPEKPFLYLDFSKFWYTLAAIGLLTSLFIAALFREEIAGSGTMLQGHSHAE